MFRILKIVIVAISAFALFGCVAPRNPDCIVTIPQTETPAPATILNLHPSIYEKDSISCLGVGNIKVDRMAFTRAFEDTELFTEEEVVYLAEVSSIMSSSWKNDLNLLIEKKDFPRISMFYNNSEEFGQIYKFGYTVTESFGKILGRGLLAEIGIQGDEKKLNELSYDLTGSRVSSLSIVKGFTAFSGMGYTYWGEDIDEEKIAAIRDGQWTVDELKATFGEPCEVKIMQDGSMMYCYYYQEFGKSKLQALNPFGNFVKDKVLVTEVLEFRVMDDLVTEHYYEQCDDECGTIL